MNKTQVLLIDAGEVSGLCPTANTGSFEKFSVTRMPTLATGLNALQELRFHLVLVDLSLAAGSPDECVNKILQKARHLPVLAVVNEGKTAEAAHALRLGVDDYVVRGCHVDLLTQSLTHAIERKHFTAGRDQSGPRTTNAEAQLTAHLSHELRNALACIHQFGTIMIDGLAGSVSEEQREYLCIMLENASKIRTVLDEALEGASQSTH
jgi:DNA-binding response OmpR family regulator